MEVARTAEPKNRNIPAIKVTPRDAATQHRKAKRIWKQRQRKQQLASTPTKRQQIEQALKEQCKYCKQPHLYEEPPPGETPIERQSRRQRMRRRIKSAIKRTKHSGEQRMKDLRYIAAESAFKMEIEAVAPGLYKAGTVSDTNKDTTDRRKRIRRIAQNILGPKWRQTSANEMLQIESSKSIPSYDVTPLLIEHSNIPQYDTCRCSTGSFASFRAFYYVKNCDNLPPKFDCRLLVLWCCCRCACDN